MEELRESTAFSLIDVKHNEITMIEEALQRIEGGEYGRCIGVSIVRDGSRPHGSRPCPMRFGAVIVRQGRKD